MITNKGNTQTTIYNNRDYKIDKIKWDATYDGKIANINIDMNENGEKSNINMNLNNDDLAKIFNISSVNQDLHNRIKNDFIYSHSIPGSKMIKNNNPMYIELNKEKDNNDINIFHKNIMKKYTPKNIKYLNNKNSKKYFKKKSTTPKTLRLQFKKHKSTV